jgi:hypothetical protein
VSHRDDARLGYGQGCWVLGFGPGGTFGHVELVLHRMPLPGEVTVDWRVKGAITDDARQEVELATIRFLQAYVTHRSILLHVTVTEVRSDPVRRNGYERAVTLALYAALRDMALPVPQLYAAPDDDPGWNPGAGD